MMVYDSKKRWWREPKETVHDAVAAAVRKLDNNQQTRRDMMLLYLRMYGNFRAVGLYGASYAVLDHNDGRLKMNVIKAVIDALCAKIGTVRPRPMYLTMRGNYEMKRRAKNLTKFSQGQFYWHKQYKTGRRVFRDACILGDGYELVAPRVNKVYSERIFPDEILVDDLETKTAPPRQMFRVKEISKDALASLYPKHAEDIAKSGPVRNRSELSSYDSLIDVTHVLDAWQLPPEENKPGRHVLCVDTCTLVDEPWEMDRFPVIPFKLLDRPLGFYGMGIAEDLFDIQVELNYLLQKIQRNMTLFTTQMWAQKGSINKGNMDNEEGTVREYGGPTPPVILSPQTVGPEYFGQIDRLWQRAFDLAGVSELSASGRKPAGLDSGEAIRNQQDVESQRFTDVQQAWEEFVIEVSEANIEAAKHIDKGPDGPYVVVAKGDKSLEQMRFRDVSLEKDKYMVQAFPTNILPATPAGKLQTIQELAQIDPRMKSALLAQLDFPDLEAAVSLANAPYEMAELLAEEMLERDRYRAPEPLWPLALLIDRLQLVALRGDIEGAPERGLEHVRRFIAEAQALLNPPAPQGAPMAPMDPAMMGGPPPPTDAAMAAAMPPMVPPAPLGAPPDMTMMPPAA